MLDGIAALEHFVLVAQSERRVEVHTRTESGWELIAIEPPGGRHRPEGARRNPLARGIYEGSGR
jgi:hypothetical protein